jgi:hypothetical protein
MAPTVDSWSLGAPTDWGSWVPHHGADVADEVAAGLADDDAARAQVRDAVLSWDAALPAGPVLTAAVWVPDRTQGEVCGLLVAELLVDVPSGPDPVGTYLSTVGRPPRERGVKTFDYSVARGEVPAGPAAIQARTWAEKATRVVVSSIVWTVVPPGSDEAIRLELTTQVPSMYDALVDQGTQIAHSLRVELA